MATIGNIRVDLSANSAAFSRDMQKASAAVKSSSAKINQSLGKMERGFLKMQHSASNMVKGMFSLKGIVGTLAGGGMFGYMAKQSLEAADAIGKTADAVGISTKTLQEYQHAAELSGVGTEKLNSVFLAFSKRIGELRAGTGPLVTYLNKFDKTLLQNLKSARNTDEALDLVFERMGEVKSATDRAALANAAFSRSGIKMTVMVKDGAAGLAAMKKEANDLGIVMDERVIRNSEKANDAVQKLSQSLKSSFTTAIAANADSIAAAVEALARAFAALGKASSQGRRLDELFKIGAVTKKEMRAAETHASLIPQILKKAEERLKSYGSALDDSWIKAKGYMPEKTTKEDEGANTTDDKPYHKNVVSLKSLTIDKERVDLNNKLIEQEKERIELQRELEQEALIALTAANDAEGQHSVALEEANKRMEEMGDVAKVSSDEIKDSFIGAFDTASDALTGFLTDGEFSFKRFVNSIISDLARMGIRKAFTSLGEGLFGSLFSAKGNVFGPSGVHAFAGGGIVNKPTLFQFANGTGIMGEAGPEAIIPLYRDASGELGIKSRGDKTGSSNYSIYINAVDAASFNELTRRNPEAIVGPIRRAMQGGDRGLIGLMREVA